MASFARLQMVRGATHGQRAVPRQPGGSMSATVRNRSPTSRATRLGHVLQAVVSRCLRGAGLTDELRDNASLADDLIAPDLLVGPRGAPRVSVHITSSDSRDSFRMKRWRYVCELFQLKSHFPDIHAINLFWGTPDLYQSADIELLEQLFDSTVDLRSDPEACRLHQEARRFTTAEESGDLAERLHADVSERLRRKLATAVRHGRRTGPRADNRVLWSTPRRRGRNGLPHGRNTRWVRLLPQLLPLLEEEFEALLAYFRDGRELPRAAVELGLMEEERGLVTTHHVEPGFRRACLDGTVAAFRSAALGLPGVAVLAREARSAAEVAWAADAYRLLSRPAERDSLLEFLHRTSDHPRLVFVDALLAFYGTSANHLEARWDHEGVPVGVKNPVANLVARTRLVDRLLARPAVLADGLLHLWQQLHSWSGEGVSEAEFVEAVCRHRRLCLFGQKVVRPTPFVVRLALERQGWSFGPRRRFAFGPVATEFPETAERVGRCLLVKCLYGDRGADHKAEEMAGRQLLLPFEMRDGEIRVRPVSAESLFVPEGVWSPGQLRLLASAGWDVVAREDLAEY